MRLSPPSFTPPSRSDHLNSIVPFIEVNQLMQEPRFEHTWDGVMHAIVDAGSESHWLRLDSKTQLFLSLAESLGKIL